MSLISKEYNSMETTPSDSPNSGSPIESLDFIKFKK